MKDWEKEKQINDQAYFVKDARESKFKTQTLSVVYSLISVTLIILGYIFVLNQGSIFDYVLSSVIITTFMVLSIVDYKKFTLFNKDYKRELLKLKKLKETPKEKLKRERLEKYSNIMKELK